MQEYIVPDVVMVPPDPKPGDTKLAHCEVSEAVIRGLLTRDLICRKTRQWPLLTSAEMEVIYLQTESLRKLDFVQCPDATFHDTSTERLTEAMGDFYTLNRRSKYYQNKENMISDSWASMEIVAHNNLILKFPLINDLLWKFEGNLIAAGGSVFKSLLSSGEAADIDLFFIDREVERDDVSDEAKKAKADQMLSCAIAHLSDLWLAGDGDPRIAGPTAERDNPVVFVLRNKFVTTVYLTSEYHSIKYQFIHRVYPNVGSVLGGFDLGPAMVAYDGKSIMATELGAWSALSRCLIIDVSRRSTSFEYRIQKYAGTCHVIFPGLSRVATPEKFKNFGTIDEVAKLLDAHIQKSGYRWGYLYDDGRDPEYNKYSLVPAECFFDKQRMVQKIQHILAEYGYKLDVEDLPISPLRDPSNPITITKEELHSELVELARQKGFALKMSRYAKFKRAQFRDLEYRNGRNEQPKHWYLKEGVRIMRLPRCEIHQNISNRWCDWTFRPLKDPSIKYAVSDYHEDSDTIQVVDSNYANRLKPSDYEDSWVLPHLTADLNLSMLATDNLNGVVSILCLKRSDCRLSTSANHKPYLDAIKDSIVNVDKYISKDNQLNNKRYLGDCIAEIIQKSFTEPKLGDFQELWRERVGRLENGFLTTEGTCWMLFRDVPRDASSLDLTDAAVVIDVMRRTKTVRDRLIDNAALVIKELTGVTWILRNPGTQWTGSINPTIEDPRQWYGEYYRSFKVGNEAIETTLRMIRRRGGNYLARMDRNIFNRLLREITWLNSL